MISHAGFSQTRSNKQSNCSYVLTDVLSCIECGLLLRDDCNGSEVDAVRHVHIAQIAAAAAEPRVVTDVAMIQWRPSHTSRFRQTFRVIRVVPAPYIATQQ